VRTGAANAVGAIRHNDNDVTMIIAGRRYGNWRHVATCCTALVIKTLRLYYGVSCSNYTFATDNNVAFSVIEAVKMQYYTVNLFICIFLQGTAMT